jgi:hypothetical protein
MHPENEFQQIGKKIPYKAPDDFFETISQKTLLKAKQSDQNFKRINKIRRMFSVAASLVAMLLIGLFIFQISNNKPGSKVVIIENQPDGLPSIQEITEIAKELSVPTIYEALPIKKPVNHFVETAKSEGISDVLTELTDNELMQMIAMYKSDPFIIASEQ